MNLCLRRREFIAGLGGAVVWPVAVSGQQRTLPVIGILRSAGTQLDENQVPFRKGLSDMGYVEGRNVIIEYRVTRQIDRLPLAAELVERRVTVIFASPRRLEAVQQLQGSAATDESRPPTK